jgi:hypothetical protein
MPPRFQRLRKSDYLSIKALLTVCAYVYLFVLGTTDVEIDEILRTALGFVSEYIDSGWLKALSKSFG